MIKEDEIVKNKENLVSDMLTSLNNGSSLSGTNEFKRIDGLGDEQNDLLEEINDLFNPEENDADRCILYEVTHY